MTSKTSNQPQASDGKKMPHYIFETRMEVRDYECDIQGIVNNANYLHYTEHTRHRFLKATGLSFSEMHARGIDAVVARMKLAYRHPLRCDDEFISRMALRKEGLRWVFSHDIYRASDNLLCFQATTDLVVLINGQLGESEEYNQAFTKYINEH